MKPKINRRQFVAIYNLLNNLKDINARKVAVISNIVTMVNFTMPKSVLIRYEKEFYSDGDVAYEYKICQVDEMGNLRFIDQDFKNIFDRYSFLGECKTFDLENPDDYEKID
jgi:hypothetical protein